MNHVIIYYLIIIFPQMETHVINRQNILLKNIKGILFNKSLDANSKCLSGFTVPNLGRSTNTEASRMTGEHLQET